MAQIARITLRTVEHAEMVHDAFDVAMADGVLESHEAVAMCHLLDLNMVSASAADASAVVAVGATRGVISSRRAQDQIHDFVRLDEQVRQLESMAPEFPLDAA